MAIDLDLASAPPSLSFEATDELNARSPFDWIRAAIRNPIEGDVLQLMAAWTAFTGLTGAAWALHLRGLAGWSALPNHWGDRITTRDIWELSENGGWRQAPIGTPASIAVILCLIWVLWAGWRLQARAVGLPNRLGPWLWGLLDALLIGMLPLLLPCLLALGLLEWLGTSGIQGLGWLRLILSPLLQATTISAFMLQWWFCRLGRASDNDPLPFSYGRHLGHSFLRLWLHPVQWFLLLFGSASLRAALGFGVIFLGWRWGGGTTVRVWGLLLLQLVASAAGAWLLGVQLRTCALFWAQDRRVREARRLLRAAYPPGVQP